MAPLEVSLHINNKSEPAIDGGTFERRSPITGEAVTVAAAAKSADVDRAVLAAQNAFVTWSSTSPEEKRKVLNSCADALEARVDEFVTLGIAETASTLLWYRNNVKLAASFLR